MHRRHFLASAIAASLAGTRGLANEKKPPRILIRSAWQTVNIGDVAHTPGLLAILEKHMPEAELVLWPSDIGNGVEEMLRKRFPKLIITPKNVDERVKITKTCDFFLHGSGAFLCAPGDVARWRATGNPMASTASPWRRKGTMRLAS